MKQLGLAMLNYQSEHGRFPPAVVYGEDGKPLYSWRVLILPFIEQDRIYQRFKLDEPWDSPHNIQLLSEMPVDYAPPPGKKSKVPAYHTVCKVFVGKGAAFEGRDGIPLKELTDTTNTILIAEAGTPVPWTKPEDFAYDPDEPLPNLDGFFKDIIRVGMADGSLRFVSSSLDEKVWRAAITRDGGKKMNMDW
jgi:hypothetical protein